jgi:hypothetical protein
LPAAFTSKSTSFRCRFDRLGDPQAGTGGLTVGYGILIRLGEFNLRLLSHECPRVHQVEAAGGLEAFLGRYLKQIADFTTTRPTSRMPKRTN